MTPSATPVDQVTDAVHTRSGPRLDDRPGAAGGARGAARGGLANIIGAGFAGGTGVLVTWLVARGLGAEQAGAFFAATAAFVLVGGVAKLGTQTGLVYWPARLRATDRAHLLGACLRIGLVPVAVLAIVLAAAMWAFAPQLARLTAGEAGHVVADHAAGLRVLAVFLPLAALTDALLTATRGYRVMRPTVMLERILRSALQRVDVLLVAALAGLVPAAIYAVAGRFVVLIQFANQGISQSVQPRLAESLATGDTAGANSLYRTATGWLVLATWPINLVVITFAPVYLGLFGDGYRAGASVVMVLACAMLVATGCGMVDMVLAMAGRTSWNLVNVLIALAVTIGLDVLLIPRYGALGAAIGLACAVTVNNLLPLVQVGRAVGLHPFGRGTLTAAALALVCFGALPTGLSLLTGTGAAGMGIALLVATPAYVAGAWLLRHRLSLDSFTRLRRTNPRRTG